MRAEILAVGTELLMGQITNTNAQYISRRLPDAGVGVYYHSVVGDNPGRLRECLDIALKRSDVIIMTGGLGPTQDDLTKETVAGIFGKKLVLDMESLERMKQHFQRVNRPMTDNNLKQAYLPEDSIILKNNNGTAPGCILEGNGKVLAMLPGPPSEMKPMFEEYVMPYLKNKLEYVLVSRHLRLFGIGESQLEFLLLDMIDGQTNPTIATYAKEGEVSLRVTAKCQKNESGENLLDPVIDEIVRRLGDTVYSIEDKNLDLVAGELLIKRNITISLAESCTGGIVSGKLTAIPGISKVFNRGIVSYSNESKIENLGVSEKTLDEFGAVSEETAKEMAEGIRRLSGTDIGLSITGVAGPEGGSEAKPVGTVFIAISDKKDTECKQLKLWGNREKIRNTAALNAFDMIRKWVMYKT